MARGSDPAATVNTWPAASALFITITGQKHLQDCHIHQLHLASTLGDFGSCNCTCVEDHEANLPPIDARLHHDVAAAGPPGSHWATASRLKLSIRRFEPGGRHLESPRLPGCQDSLGGDNEAVFAACRAAEAVLPRKPVPAALGLRLARFKMKCQAVAPSVAIALQL